MLPKANRPPEPHESVWAFWNFVFVLTCIRQGLGARKSYLESAREARGRTPCQRSSAASSTGSVCRTGAGIRPDAIHLMITLRSGANVLAQREKPGRIMATFLTPMSCPAGTGGS